MLLIAFMTLNPDVELKQLFVEYLSPMVENKGVLINYMLLLERTNHST